MKLISYINRLMLKCALDVLKYIFLFQSFSFPNYTSLELYSRIILTISNRPSGGIQAMNPVESVEATTFNVDYIEHVYNRLC